MKKLLISLIAVLIVACNSDYYIAPTDSHITFENIKFFRTPVHSESNPFKYRLSYYFDNGKLCRWMELDSLGKVMTDYICEYDKNWKQTGARYREDSATDFSIERVRFENDRAKVTEWIDSIGNVYYTMTDFLNHEDKTFRAEFKGDKIHGYDSTFYTKQGFTKRIFFTNTKGKVFNDRTFKYDSINNYDDWVGRKKIMNDSVMEIQIRETYYDSNFVTKNGIFYQGILSTGELSENVFSFTKDQKQFFQTRTSDWDNQFGYLSKKINGLFTESIPFTVLDTIYNGAISPNGNKIIFCLKKQKGPQVWLMEKDEDNWLEPFNLTQHSKIKGGYFYWLSDNELFFYTPENNGDIVQGKLENNHLTIIDSLPNLNTKSGTEFSPYVDKDKRFIVFTRYIEGDTAQQGFFISYNLGDFSSPEWSSPEKLTRLPYGWNAYFINSESQFLYTNGDDIISVPSTVLNLKI
ncbi:MAG: hypothetical protein HKO66_14285 [Saprospiraceae bacterium]|nr:PD40 domain-containing protein [Bacteroidia bacterium]NNL93406.1 hypothetical protein [Saprospiraceae bacterium]